jgi:hypothetical protein
VRAIARYLYVASSFSFVVVFVRDEGSVFEAPIAAVWRFVGSGNHHSEAHRHRKVRRRQLPGNAGRYSWEQDFLGRPERFTMSWVSYHPVGVAYRVLAGPFAGSRFFLYYLPRGRRTGVAVVGDFVSPTIPDAEIPAAVDRFFSLEFEQDRTAIEADVGAGPRNVDPRPSREPGPRGSRRSKVRSRPG